MPGFLRLHWYSQGYFAVYFFPNQQTWIHSVVVSLCCQIPVRLWPDDVHHQNVPGGISPVTDCQWHQMCGEGKCFFYRLTQCTLRPRNPETTVNNERRASVIFTVQEKCVEENIGREMYNCKKMSERLILTYFPQNDIQMFFSST